MKQDDKAQNLLDNARQILDHSVDAIDKATASRLRQIRYQALDNKSEKFNWLKPYSAVAVTTAVLVLAVSVWLTQLPSINDALVFEDISLLTSDEELEFYQQLEFYNWLEDEQSNG